MTVGEGRYEEALREIRRLGVKFDAKGTHSQRVYEIADAALRGAEATSTEGQKWCERCGDSQAARIETVEGRGPGWTCLGCGWWNWLAPSAGLVSAAREALMFADAVNLHSEQPPSEAEAHRVFVGLSVALTHLRSALAAVEAER